MFSCQFFRRRGQSLIELLVALAVGMIFIMGAIATIVPALLIARQQTPMEIGIEISTELTSNVRAWSEGNWHNVLALATGSTNLYYLNTSSSPFTAVGASSTNGEHLTFGTSTYLRSFYLGDVYRNGGVITATGTYDPSTKFVTVAYTEPTGATGSVLLYLTRHFQNIYDQTDWSGGGGVAGPATSTNNKFFAATSTDYIDTIGSLTASGTVATGTLDSTTFDTADTQGAQLNSVLWQGSLPAGTDVAFQIAVSNASSGPWNYMGPDGTPSTYFDGGNPGASVAFTPYASYENFRYFRYRVTLTTNSAHTLTPRVDDIIINWSP